VVLYSGFLSSEKPLQDLASLRTASKLVDKLEKLANKDDNGWVLKDGTQTLKLEDSEYTLLSDIMRNAKWRPQFAREALRAVEFLEAALETDGAET
jgi:hypothetical protein